MDVASVIEFDIWPLQNSGGIFAIFSHRYLKGELFGGEFDKVKKATDYANEIIKEAIDNNYDTNWMEQHIPKLIKILELDSWFRSPYYLQGQGSVHHLTRTTCSSRWKRWCRHKKDDVQKKTKDVYEGQDVLQEFEALITESKRQRAKAMSHWRTLV